MPYIERKTRILSNRKRRSIIWLDLDVVRVLPLQIETGRWRSIPKEEQILIMYQWLSGNDNYVPVA